MSMEGVGQGLADGIKTAGSFILPVLQNKINVAAANKRAYDRMAVQLGIQDIMGGGDPQPGAQPAAMPAQPAAPAPMPQSQVGRLSVPGQPVPTTPAPAPAMPSAPSPGQALAMPRAPMSLPGIRKPRF